MANQNAKQDDNQVWGLVGHSGTAGTAETRKAVVEEGKLWVKTFDSLIANGYDNIAMTYPTGTTEVYTYKTSSTPVGTVTVTYTDSTKGSISTVVKS